MADRDPWIKFYPKDYLSDLELATCSAAAQGVYMRLLCLMHVSNEYGFVLINGCVPATKTYAKLLQLRTPTCTKAVAELLDKGVLKQDERGALYSKRMLSDREKREVMRERGKLGGNPALVNPKVNPKVKPEQNKKENKNKKEITPPTPQGGNAALKREFEKWWASYPNKQGKDKATVYWISRRSSGQSEDELTRGRDAYKKFKANQGSDTFANGSTFLNPKPRGDSANIDDYIEIAKVQAANEARAKEATARRDAEIANRQPAPPRENHPDPKGAAKIREAARQIAEGKMA